MKTTICSCTSYSIEFHSTGFFTKFLNKIRQFLIALVIKLNTEFFYVIEFVNQVN